MAVGSRVKKPWLTTLYAARNRCSNPKLKGYYRYGGRGIKCFLTPDEIHRLWIRDGAAKMRKPSIDRIDNDGHYEFSNCRFIELSANCARVKLDLTGCPQGHPYTKESTYIRPNGARECYICRLQWRRDHFARKAPEIRKYLREWKARRKAALSRPSSSKAKQ